MVQTHLFLLASHLLILSIITAWTDTIIVVLS
jgi:hypothetical protein